MNKPKFNINIPEKYESADIKIAITGPLTTANGLLSLGAELAADEINEAGGILDKKKVGLILFDNDNKKETAREIARYIAKHGGITGVISGSPNRMAHSEAIIYEYGKNLSIFTESTSPSLTLHGFETVFRMVPTDYTIGAALVKFKTTFFKNDKTFVYVLHEGSNYGRGLSINFQLAISDSSEIVIADQKSYNPWEEDFRPMLSKMKGEKFDAILLSGRQPAAARIIRQIREMGFKQPIFGGNGLDDYSIVADAGAASEGLITVSVYDKNSKFQHVKKFIKDFNEKFGRAPDHHAAQAYDSVKLISHAIEKAGRSEPKYVTDALHFVHDWQGVTGTHTFLKNGDVQGKEIVFKILRKGIFIPIWEEDISQDN